MAACLSLSSCHLLNGEWPVGELLQSSLVSFWIYHIAVILGLHLFPVLSLISCFLISFSFFVGGYSILTKGEEEIYCRVLENLKVFLFLF